MSILDTYIHYISKYKKRTHHPKPKNKMKTHTTVSVDAELIEKAKTLNINVSGNFNDYLSSLINQRQNNLEGINIELEMIKQRKLQTQFNNIKMELDDCTQKIGRYQELEEQKKQQELEKEKQRIEASTKCINCGSFLEEGKKSHRFPKGNVCNGCFLSSNSESIKRWN